MADPLEDYSLRKYLLPLMVPIEETRPSPTRRYKTFFVVDSPNPREEAISLALHRPLFARKERTFFSFALYLVSVLVPGLVSRFVTKPLFLTLKKEF